MSSELRVNKLTSRSGVGTVTFNDSGVIITGIATAAALDITGNATIAGVLSMMSRMLIPLVLLLQQVALTLIR